MMVRKLQERKFKEDAEMDEDNELDILDGVAYDQIKEKDNYIAKKKENRRVVLA